MRIPSAFTLTGLMALAGGLVGYNTFPEGLRVAIKQFINLAENGMVYPMYMKPPFKARSTFYLFSIRNPTEVLRGARMSFDVKGPFVFDTMLTRENIAFSQAGEKVAFDSGRKLAVDESKSANLDEKLWLVNPILPSTAKTVKSVLLDRLPLRRFSEPIVFSSVNVLLSSFGERLMMRLSAREILEGRTIEMLEALTSLASRFGVEGLLPPGPPDNKFGLAFVQNKTIDPVEIYTGVGETRDRFAEVTKFRGANEVKVWRGKCNKISGTNGELYKPNVQAGEPIRVFLNPLCRSFDMVPVGGVPRGGPPPATVATESGVRGLEYEFDPRLFRGVRNNSDNKCFCERLNSYDCQYDGLISMGPCFFDAPLYFSKANFKDVNPRIRNLVDWQSMVPTEGAARAPSRLPERQAIKLEPITGTVLEADVTLVALFKVVRQPGMGELSGIQNLTYAPLFATTETIKLPFRAVWQVYYLQKLSENYKLVMGGAAASGALMLVLKFLFSWL